MSQALRSIPPVALALLAGCAQMPAPPAATAEAPVSRPSAFDARRSEVIANHRKLAEAAKKDGDLSTAAMQWQIVMLLAPDNDSYRREWTATRAAIAAQVKEQLQAGSAAMSAGDLDRANQAMLRVLALDPNQPDAAAALREIDRRRFTRIQADRAAKVVRIEDKVAIAGTMRAQAAAGESGDGFDLEQALLMLRGGDATGGIRDLKAFVDANPGNRAARLRIGAAVAERARELEDQGSREQALQLYEQATLLRGDGAGPWAARLPPLRHAVSQDYFDKGARAYRTNIAQAIAFFETSLRYDPANTQAALKLKDARMAREKLDKIDKIDKDARKP
jgi:tetratricopeptide (TPR) repeat protein